MDNELYHYGILGMKWGVRRFQNADGTRTEAGKKRYQTKSDDGPHYNVDPREVKRNMDQMTDAELQRAINRINMQSQVDKMNPSIVGIGRRWLTTYNSDTMTVTNAISNIKKLLAIFNSI